MHLSLVAMSLLPLKQLLYGSKDGGVNICKRAALKRENIFLEMVDGLVTSVSIVGSGIFAFPCMIPVEDAPYCTAFSSIEACTGTESGSLANSLSWIAAARRLNIVGETIPKKWYFACDERSL